MRIVHKRAVFEGGFVCDWRPGPQGWAGKSETFWDKVTCHRCLAKRKPRPAARAKGEGA